MDQTVVLHKLTQGGKSAGDVFRAVLSGNEESKKSALTVIAQNPERALQIIGGSPDDLGLSEMAVANSLDEVIAQIPDPEIADQMMKQNIPNERLVEIIATRGELPSVVSHIVDLDTLVLAILSDVLVSESTEEPDDLEDVTPSASLMFSLRSWAIKLNDRPDYDEFLNYEIGDFLVKEYLVMAIYHKTSKEEITIDQFSDLGIDAEEGHEILDRMLDEGLFPQFNGAELLDAKVQISKRLNQKRTEDASIRNVLTVANELDI